MKKIAEEILSEVHLQRYENAIALCNKWIFDDPQNAVAYELKGDCYYSLKNFPSAIDSYNLAINFSNVDGKSESEKISLLYTKIGICQLKQKNYSDAILCFTKSLNYNPTNVDAYLQRSKTYRELQKFNEALEDATRAINLSPENARAYNSRGICNLYLSRGNDAIADFDSAIRLNPDYAQAYHNRGNAYHQLLHDFTRASLDWDIANKLILEKTAKTEVKSADDIPEFSIDKIFNKNLSDEKKQDEKYSSSEPEDIDLNKEIAKVEIPEELKRLHNEIEGINSPLEHHIEKHPPISVYAKPAQKLADIYIPESREKSVLTKNILIIFSLIVFILLIIWAIYYSLVLSRRAPGHLPSEVKNNLVINERSSQDTTGINISSSLDSLIKSASMMLVASDTGYYLQVGSFKEKEFAEQKAKSYEENNLEANVYESKDSINAELYKVRIGKFQTLTEIDSILKIIKNE